MTDPHRYIARVAAALEYVRVHVGDHHTQTRESRYTDGAQSYEGGIQIGDGHHPDDVNLPDPHSVTLAWDAEDGWRILHGGQDGAHDNVIDLTIPVHAAPAQVVAAALATTHVTPATDPHDRYINAVVAALDDARHYVKDWTSCTDEVAEALIELNDTEALSWTECEGWTHLTGREPGGHYANAAPLLIGIVPTPAAVVARYAQSTAGAVPVTSGAHRYRDPAAVDQELPEDAEAAAMVAAELAKY